MLVKKKDLQDMRLGDLVKIIVNNDIDWGDDNLYLLNYDELVNLIVDSEKVKKEYV